MVSENEKAHTVASFMLLFAELLICTGIGGFYGWPAGTLIFGVLFFAHSVRGMYRIRKRP